MNKQMKNIADQLVRLQNFSPARSEKYNTIQYGKGNLRVYPSELL